MYLQSAVKYVLTQGDSLIVTTMASLSDQGAYALASNYGGLVARMIFQPIEETSRNLFAKLWSVDPQTQKVVAGNSKQVKTILVDILKFYNIIGLVSSALGPSLAPLLLRVVAGAKWSDTGAGEVLATFSYYIPLLALNGITEAFVAAVASNKDLRWQSLLMGAYFACFSSAAFTFLKVWGLGASGIVWANCCNMIFRIVWNISFIKKAFRQANTVGSYRASKHIQDALSFY